MKDIYGIPTPVSWALVHLWMRMADYNFDRAAQTEYTDGHNKTRCSSFEPAVRGGTTAAFLLAACLSADATRRLEQGR
ncbi:unnamed protein product [Ectocarpus sp. CCAP 1310/34]|nr:unnamed protein product [Ectocarpus sp. CCAP 1310/34]